MKDLKPLIPYRITKSNTEKTICEGDLIWLSENGILNLPSGGGFFIEPEEQTEETLDFAAEEDTEYKIVVIPGFSESIRKK